MERSTPAPVEHLVLKWELVLLGGRWTTKYHENLGADLQEALEVLEAEGWEAGFASYLPGQPLQIVLKRRRPDAAGR